MSTLTASIAAADTVNFGDLKTGAPLNHLTVTLGSKKTLFCQADTFTEAGKVGVWTKADSVTLFDAFSYAVK